MTPLRIPSGKKRPGRGFWIRLILFVCCLAGALLLQLVRRHMIGELSDLGAAARFAPGDAYTQISCYFADGVFVPPERTREFHYKIESGLITNSITREEENADARLFVTCYSAEGTLEISRDGKIVKTKAIGTGGDFFLLHPVELVSGMTYQPDGMSDDQVLIDESLAWQLFGGTDLAGQEIVIGERTHFVRGVVRTGEGHFLEAAGYGGSLIYLPAETLIAEGTLAGTEGSVSCFEAVLPDPVRGFAADLVKNQIAFDETQMQVLDHRVRFSPSALLRVLKSFGTRSMVQSSFRYPYWENVARGTEDVLALVLLMQALLLFTAILIFVLAVIRLYRGKTWTAAGILSRIGEGIYERQANHGSRRFPVEDLEEVHL